MNRVSPRREGANRAVGAQTLLQSGDTSRRPDVVVAAPVCNEIERIEACLDALAATLSRQANAGVVLMVNNSVDGTANRAVAVLTKHRTTAIVVDMGLASPMATAGWARRLALDTAAQWGRPDAVLMTTDADGRVAADWAEANLSLLAQGAHLVCGRIEPDPVEAHQLPACIAARYAVEQEYAALSIELDARLDPRPHDPWPHHGIASGASLAVRARDYVAVGRMPPIACREDRAFAALVEHHDLCVRHSDAPVVTVSCRLQGRAQGGMADALAARVADPDSFADQMLLPAETTARRATFRKALREARSESGDIIYLMRQLGACETHIARGLRTKTFGALWAAVEAGSDTLRAARMRPSDLARELPTLRKFVAQARSAS